MMSKIYYKAFNRDKTCLGFKYEEGETYEIEGELELCQNGFHFCLDLVLTLDYYPVKNITENLYAEVEPVGDVIFEQPTKHKGCTSKIKILRFLTDEEVLTLIDNKNNSGDCNSGDSNSGHRNSGHRNSGDSNSGHSNSGHRNSGYSNSGHSNSGHRNSGCRNSGHRNSGDWNSGCRNSGHRNSGDWNSGDSNSGCRNSGSWNSCNYETGFFNSKNIDTIRVFNKDCDRQKWEDAEKPDFIYFELDTDLGYKKSFQKSFDSASLNDIKLLKALPNFDADVFFEISGIRIDCDE